MHYDIIGDTHGHSDKLLTLLDKLGYKQIDGCYRHSERKAIFLGDFVDAGDDVRGVLQIVRPMVEQGTALAVIGNHEFNVISYLTPNGYGGYIREHNAKNDKQIEKTLQSFADYPDELTDYIKWFCTLPLYLEQDGLRVVHACWLDEDITFIKQHYPDNCLSTQLLKRANRYDTPEHKALIRMIGGVEVELLDEYQFKDRTGHVRKNLRIRWWQDLKGKTIREAATRENDMFPDILYNFPDTFMYRTDAKPLFLGHYCLDSEVMLQAPNVACVDFCVTRTGRKRLACYRWDGEQILDEKKWVL